MKIKTEVTIYDIAEALKLSPSTVSRALSDHPAIRKDTKKKIHAYALEMGYQHNSFASNLRKKRTNTIGVIIPRVDSYFQSTIISGIEKVASENGYNLIISQSLDSFAKEAANVKTMFNSRVDGLLISFAGNNNDISYLDLFFRKGISVIFFDRVFPHPDCTSIIIDNYKAAHKATTHLIEQGCSRIVHLTNSVQSSVYTERHRGYRQALLDANIIYDPELVMNTRLNDLAGLEALKKMSKLSKKPDGFFTANDTSAVSVICHLKSAGYRVPEDICIIGFNNDPISRVIEPNLSTVSYPGDSMGEIAAQTLINRLNNRQMENIKTIVLDHELIIRKSSMKKEQVSQKNCI
jgi:LacI family transcriptional regulator